MGDLSERTSLDDLAKKLQVITKNGQVYGDHVSAIDHLPHPNDPSITYNVIIDCDAAALTVRQVNEVRLTPSGSFSMGVTTRNITKEWQKNPLIAARVKQIREEADLS